MAEPGRLLLEHQLFLLSKVGSSEGRELAWVLVGPLPSGYREDNELRGARADTGPCSYYGCVERAGLGGCTEAVPSGCHPQEDVGPSLGSHLASALCHTLQVFGKIVPLF